MAWINWGVFGKVLFIHFVVCVFTEHLLGAWHCAEQLKIYYTGKRYRQRCILFLQKRRDQSPVMKGCSAYHDRIPWALCRKYTGAGEAIPNPRVVENLAFMWKFCNLGVYRNMVGQLPMRSLGSSLCGYFCFRRQGCLAIYIPKSICMSWLLNPKCDNSVSWLVGWLSGQRPLPPGMPAWVESQDSHRRRRRLTLASFPLASIHIPLHTYV